MAHADDATKVWVSATPTVNADSNVTRWNLKYKYTLAVADSDDYVHTFDSTVRLTPTKAKTAYTRAELLALDDGGKQISTHWDDMFNKKYAYHISIPAVATVDASFDVSGLSTS